MNEDNITKICTNLRSQSMTDSKSLEEKIQLSFLNRIPNCSIPLPKFEASENHVILILTDVQENDTPSPYPSTYRDIWDCWHVRMPCSCNEYPEEDISEEKQLTNRWDSVRKRLRRYMRLGNGRKNESRWDLIRKSLSRNIKSSRDLEDAISEYNVLYKKIWNFDGLHAFFDQHLSKEESMYFIESVLPGMINMALELPNICTQPPPLLKKNKDCKLTMSQKQIGCLLLNAFFCTFPGRNKYSNYQSFLVTNEYATYSDINFNRIFFGLKNEISSSNAEKIKCLINYFKRIITEEPTGTVTFHRQCLNNFPNWLSQKELKKVVIQSDGLIETDGYGMLQVDFANKFVGGNVFGEGCVQEEIRFVICPELIVSRLFVESLEPNEVLIVTGVEQYSSYSGYNKTFKFEGNYIDKTQRDAWGRKCTQVVAMDALFVGNSEQYIPHNIEREFKKAYCGFYEDALPENLSAVATGNWGCGAFNGDPILKFIIQWMAASETGREMLYFTCGDKSLMMKLQKIYNFYKGRSATVYLLWELVNRYFQDMELNPLLYEYICVLFEDKNYLKEVILINTEVTEQLVSE